MFSNMSHGSVTGARTSSCNIIFNIMLKLYLSVLHGRRSHLRVTCSECDLKAGPSIAEWPSKGDNATAAKIYTFAIAQSAHTTAKTSNF